MKLIAALSKNYVIGNGLEIPWHISEDLKRFKKLTSGGTIVMGRKTYESIGRPLPKRKNIVFSRSKKRIEGCSVRSSIKNFLKEYKNKDDVWVIGGSEIYRMFLPYCDEMYITRVHEEHDGDILFPVDAVDAPHWKIMDYFFTNNGSSTYSFERYVRSDLRIHPSKRPFLPTIISVS
jgi:dihydrofolate reductase